MSIKNKIAQYKAYKRGVLHTTFDPDGPGVVRMHLVPPKFRLIGNPSYILILNGYYLLPVGYSWAIMLGAFIDELNLYDGKQVTDKDIEIIINNTLTHTSRVYPCVRREYVREDLEWMLEVLFAIARGGKPDAEIERMSVRAYSHNMSAPHRMDLMISAMTDKDGRWNCNQHCSFCYAAGQPLSSSRELSTDEWKCAIDRLREAGVPMITFTGGEPTVRADLCELVAYAKWHVTRLNTNGINMTDELCASLKEASLDSVQFTFYSSDEEVHNALVGGEHYKDTLRGIRAAVTAGLDVSVNTPLSKKNADYLPTLELVHSLGVRFVTLSGLICTGRAEGKCDSSDLTEEELYSIVKEAKEFCDAHSMEMDFTSPGLISKEKLESLSLNVPTCGAALSNMAISPDGRVIPCQSWLKDGAALGNILTDRFSDIWNNKKCKALRSINDAQALTCPFREEAR